MNISMVLCKIIIYSFLYNVGLSLRLFQILVTASCYRMDIAKISTNIIEATKKQKTNHPKIYAFTTFLQQEMHKSSPRNPFNIRPYRLIFANFYTLVFEMLLNSVESMIRTIFSGIWRLAWQYLRPNIKCKSIASIYYSDISVAVHPATDSKSPELTCKNIVKLGMVKLYNIMTQVSQCMNDISFNENLCL